MKPSPGPLGAGEHVNRSSQIPENLSELVADIYTHWPTKDGEEFLQFVWDIICSGSDMYRSIKQGDYEMAGAQSDKATIALLKAFPILQRNFPGGDTDQRLLQLLRSITKMRLRASPTEDGGWEPLNLNKTAPVTALVNKIRSALEGLSQRPDSGSIEQ